MWLIDTDWRSLAPATLGAELLSRCFSQNRIPVFWLVVRLICGITPQLCKAPCSEQLTATFNPESMISFNYCNFIFFFSSSHTLCKVLYSHWWNRYVSPAHLKSKNPTTLDKYSSANDPDCPTVHKRREDDYSQRVFSWLSFLPCPPAFLLSRPNAVGSGQRTGPFAAAEDTESEEHSKFSLSLFPLKQPLAERNTWVVAVLGALFFLLQIIELSPESHSPPVAARSLLAANRWRLIIPSPLLCYHTRFITGRAPAWEVTADGT